ncbi:hypothetical protein FRB94_004402 [Tulasnella sp. JGI-2019a]|nr:hypothetical protein FRB94_004402 [Tulasnella sp. JGI-2019a]
MLRYDTHDDYDEHPPGTRQPITYPALTTPFQTRTQQGPWSPEVYSSDEYDGDGGAIASYLEMERARQERGQGTAGAGLSGQRWQDEERDPLGREYGRTLQREPQVATGRSLQGGERQEGNGGSQSSGRHYNRRRRQEASDISVEALDLADYSNTFNYTSYLGKQNTLSREMPTFNQVPTHDYTRYPQNSMSSRAIPPLPSNLDDAPSRDRPFSAQSRRSRGTVQSGRTSLGPPPSFVSARDRLSSPLSQNSHSKTPKASQKTRRQPKDRTRHMSLPPVFGEPGDIVTYTQPDSIAPDVHTFPKWSREWYDPSSRPTGSSPSSPPVANHETDLGVWPPQAVTTSTHGAASALPWGRTISHPGHTLQMSDPPQYVSETVREERMRMLEKEFGGGKGKSKGPYVDGEGMIGSVDVDGSLVTDGPKARKTVRVMQALLALSAAVSGIYGAIAIHPLKPAPPAATPPAYVLYAFSVITFLFSVYFFGLRPCIRRRKHNKVDGFTGHMGASGMMVLPVMQGTGPKGTGGRKGNKNKKGQGRGPEDGVQVNLIVDPSIFGGDGSRRERRSRHRRDEEEGGSDTSGSSDSGAVSASKRHHRPKRRNVFEAMALENDWKAARRTLKWQFAVDIVFLILWGAVFFYVMYGKRCPPGGFEGWCNAYNVSSACACLLAFAFAFGIFYDIKDLSASKVSPRTRT